MPQRERPRKAPAKSPKASPKAAASPAVLRPAPKLSDPLPEAPSLSGAPLQTANERRAAEKDALWRRYFAEPGAFYDNRATKSNPRAPDFKAKEGGAFLYVKEAPEWAKRKLLGGSSEGTGGSGSGGGGGASKWRGGAYVGGEARVPPLKGKKPTPAGRHDALTALKPPKKGAAKQAVPMAFVLTGLFPSLERDEMENFIKRHGGRVTTAVSGKTSYLVRGDEPGEKKVAAAEGLGVEVIDEDGVFAMVTRKGPPVADRPPPADKPPAAPAAFAGGSGSGSVTGKSAGQSAGAVAGELWTDKWAPKDAGDLVGGKASSDRLLNWLKSWDATFNKRGVKPKVSDKNGPKKAVLMSGPPGIGKTSMAKLIAKAGGYTVMEVNASDARGKAQGDVLKGVGGSTANRVRELVTNRTFSFGRAGGGMADVTKTLLIMDEVDGMSAGDRGGVADLIKTIGMSKIPIICICNDKYSMKLRSLQGHCVDMAFRRPTKQMVAKRLAVVSAREGMTCDQMALEQMAEECNNDIRLSLNMLQMFHRRGKTMRFVDVKEQFAAGGKDVDMSIFAVHDQLFSLSAERLSINARLDLAFHDADLCPLFVADNCINYKTNKPQDELYRMERYARAADAISQSDGVARKVRAEQAWALMPLQLVLGVVEPAALMRGGREALGSHDFRPRFPAWLGKNSSTSKNVRLLQELNTHMTCSGHYQGTPLSMRMDFVPALRALLAAPLRDRSASADDAIGAVLAQLDAYSLTKEDFDTLMSEFRLSKAMAADPLAGVDSKTKAALTRKYNAGSHAVHSSIMLDDGAPKAKRRKVKAEKMDAAGDNDVVALDDAGADVLEEEEDDDGASDAIAGLVKKRGKAGKGKGKAAAKGKGKGKAKAK